MTDGDLPRQSCVCTLECLTKRGVTQQSLVSWCEDVGLLVRYFGARDSHWAMMHGAPAYNACLRCTPLRVA